MSERVREGAVDRADDDLAVSRAFAQRAVVAQPLADLVMTEARDLEIGTLERSVEKDLVGWLGVPTNHEEQPRPVPRGELDRAVGAQRGDQQPVSLPVSTAAPSR